ncbi:MAG: HAMP domain-containing sensor histidine kinase [Cyclobacteriaceae bacterium]
MIGSVLGLIALALQFFSIEQRRTPAYFLQQTADNIGEEIEQVRIVLDSTNLTQISENTHFQFPTYLFENGRLDYWNEFRVVPSHDAIKGQFDSKFIELPQGKFIAVKKSEGNSELVALLILQATPAFYNQYLENSFNEKLLPDATIYLDEAGAEEHNLILDGQPLFGIKYDLQSSIVNLEVQGFILALFFAALFFIYLFIHLVSWDLGRRRRVGLGLITLIAGLLSLRAGMIIFELPLLIYPAELFNPLNYASSSLNPSLGDLWLNVLSILAISTYVLRFTFWSKLYSHILKWKPTPILILVVLMNLFGFFLLSFHFGLTLNILKNSQINLDINNSLTIGTLRLFAIVTIFTSSVIWFQYTHLIYRISNRVIKPLQNKLFAYLIAAILYAVVTIFIDIDVTLIVASQLGYLLLLHLFRLPDFLAEFKYSTLFYFFTATVLLALIGTVSIYKHYEFDDRINKQRFANELLIENDLKGEYLLHDASIKIQEDPFIKSRLISPLLSGAALIRQKIERDYLGGYFEKYDVRVRLYDKEGMPFEANDSTLHEIRQNHHFDPEYQTDYPGLYFVYDINSEQPKRYLRVIPINRFDQLVGYLLLDLRLKRAIPRTVYPELMVDSRYSDSQQAYDFALYFQDHLNYKSGDFNYEADFESEDLQEVSLYTKGLERGRYHHLGIKASGNRTFIITSRVYPFGHLISNFSLIFLCNFLGVLVIVLVSRLYQGHQPLRFNFSAKVQLYLNLAFFIPLVIASIVVLNSLTKSYRNEIDRSSIKKVSALKDNLVNHLDDFLSNRANRELLSNYVSEISKHSQSDITLFDYDGKLITSSQPLIYSNNLLSNRINPEALSQIANGDEELVVLNESVGELEFKTTYAAIKSYETGHLLGIMGVPFFSSKNHLREQQIDTFTKILDVFTLVLIASLFLSNLTSRLLTQPLNLLAQKIKKTSLSVTNEPLDWDRNDEIGMVVKEYNRMLVNLEESKEALAKSQKESAWREIAKQVAHEIKNPLTPMKLSLQHLKRVISDSKTGKDFDKPIDNLLYQIESLSDIASSFSAFAKMPIPENKVFELTAEVRRITDLFRNEEVNLEVNIGEENCFVLGDQKLIGRIISNLIINGIQAIPEGKDGRVVINLGSDKSKITLEVKDNGTGIPEEIQSKIFVPNFSTKKTGSGIGLAVAKRGIEHAGGSIWFESDVNGGTTFFITLPRVT